MELMKALLNPHLTPAVTILAIFSKKIAVDSILE